MLSTCGGMSLGSQGNGAGSHLRNRLQTAQEVRRGLPQELTRRNAADSCIFGRPLPRHKEDTMNSDRENTIRPNPEAAAPKDPKAGVGIGTGIGIGMSFGVALGLLTKNLALGISIGVALGAGVDAALEETEKRRKKPKN